MSEELDYKSGMKKLEKEFGSRMQFLFHQLYNLALLGQPCDITLYKSKPHINVKIRHDFILALMYGAGPGKLAQMLSEIKLSNGAVVGPHEIWTIHPMPSGGFTQEELENVNIARAEDKVGPNGESLREMIRNTYHCETKDQEDYYIRRYLAS